MNWQRVAKAFAVLALVSAGGACGAESSALSAGPPTIAVKARPSATPPTPTRVATSTSPLSAVVVSAATTAPASEQQQPAPSPGTGAAAPTASLAPATTPAPAPTTPPTLAPTTPATPAPVTLSVSMKDTFFSPTKLTVRAGQQVTVTATNDGESLHNWAVVNPNDPSGTHPESPLLKHGERAQVIFIIAQPGTYTFHCDVHLKEMTGTLNVQ